MPAETVILLIIYILVALIMLTIGISQLKSKKPVGFYTGEKPPKPEDLTDVQAWNKKHGTMWVIYGIIIVLSALAGIPFLDSLWSMISMTGGVVVPLIFMVWYHHRLIRQYLKK